MKRLILALIAVVGFQAGLLASVWGSFDTTRINYSSGTLNGSAHGQLRSIITASGGTVAADTPLLTAAYLSGIDVFYTSLLSTTTGQLSAAEQTALQNWIAAGGTLIVTADIFPLPAYESFTSFYGVTGYTALSNNQTGNVVASHPITQGVSVYRYNTESTFSYGADALLLGDNGQGSDFMIVMEPATGFSAGGRILVFGDHNMFTDSHIGLNDNTTLATNMAAWAGNPCSPASWNNYGTGWAGTLGIPQITPSGDPVLGTTISIQIDNSSGATAVAMLLVGVSPANIPTNKGGTILVDWFLPLFYSMPAGGLNLSAPLPADPAVCGISVFLQALEVDAGATKGLSFTPGLELALGS